MTSEEPLRKRPRLAVFRNATQALTLDSIRNDLIRQEETIIFALIERAQFARNACVYNSESRALRECIAQTFYTFIRLRPKQSQDECAIFDVVEALEDGASLRDAWIATIVNDDLFARTESL